MTKHMSLRLAWHNDGWNGHICNKPCENIYCIGQRSYPGNSIAGTRDIKYETEHAGESCSSLMRPAACGLSINAFGKERFNVKVDIPDFWQKESAESADIVIPPYTACTWCYEPMYSDKVKAPESSNRMYDYDKRWELAEKYFSQFEEGKSLVFYCAGYSNPFSENEEENFVIVGVSRLKTMGDFYFYKNASREVKKKYAGGFVWQKPVTSNYPDEGFCIPYWKYKDNEEVLNKIVLKPVNRAPFKYGSREVSNDDAIEIINQLLSAVDALIEVKDDTENWSERKAWLNSLLNELWDARGPYPGFASILENLKLHDQISRYIALTNDDDMKTFRDDVFKFIKGEQEQIAGQVIPKKEATIAQREFLLKGDAAQKLLIDIFPRFDITAKQMANILSDNREDVSITATLEEILANPYIISEQYQGMDPDDAIPLYKIDNGVISSPAYGIDDILDIGSWERLRGFCVDELNKIAAHSFGKASIILEAINNRIDRLPEWKRYIFVDKYFDIYKKELEGALHLEKDKKDVLYLYLKNTYDDERIIESVFKSLAERPEIQLKMAVTKEGFKRKLKISDSPLIQKAPERYEEILDKQAETCCQIFNKPICILSGAAGTGKTTVIKAILDKVREVHGYGVSCLLLAPTGKASERIKVQTGRSDASTIHSFLAKNGWVNENLTLKRKGGKTDKDFNTIIIDECSMIDLNLFATLVKAINWNSVQRLILVGDPNQLPPIGRGKVFADVIKWLKKEYPNNVGKLTENIRQLVNTVGDKGHGILDLADLFIQEKQQNENEVEAKKYKESKEILFEKILEYGNGKIDKDLDIYFWKDQAELEMLLKDTIAFQCSEITQMDIDSPRNKLWHASMNEKNNKKNPERIQIISPYRGEFYGTESINSLMQKEFNSKWSDKKTDGISYLDKVIQIKNRTQSDPAYAFNEKTKKNEKREIFNGEIGVAIAHELDKNKYETLSKIERIQVAFSGESRQGYKYNYGKDLGEDCEHHKIPNQKVIDNLELAYAISVHKSQGSEFDYVFIVIPKKDSRLLSMELLYTAITRAQKKAIILLQDDISTLTNMSHVEKSAVRKINSSIFEFNPLPDELLYLKGWYESGKKISTISEYLVRSKSEAIIANMLFEREIPFEYEKPLYAPDGTMYLPDFTVIFRGEEYYWEHLGLIENSDYSAHWKKKEEWYNNNFPGKLIITLEGNDLSEKANKIINENS